MATTTIFTFGFNMKLSMKIITSVKLKTSCTKFSQTAQPKLMTMMYEAIPAKYDVVSATKIGPTWS